MRNQSLTYLKVKIKSLSEEARIIKKEEKKAKLKAKSPFVQKSGQSPKYWRLRNELYRHRIDVVRRVCRETNLVYAFLRGMPYNKVEPTCHYLWFGYPISLPVGIKNMLRKYGNVDNVEAFGKTEQSFRTKPKEKYEAELKEQEGAFKRWLVGR